MKVLKALLQLAGALLIMAVTLVIMGILSVLYFLFMWPAIVIAHFRMKVLKFSQYLFWKVTGNYPIPVPGPTPENQPNQQNDDRGAKEQNSTVGSQTGLH